MACASSLRAVRLNHLPYEVPDHPGDEGDDDLDKAHNKPQDVHHQEKHHRCFIFPQPNENAETTNNGKLCSQRKNMSKLTYAAKYIGKHKGTG